MAEVKRRHRRTKAEMEAARAEAAKENNDAKECIKDGLDPLIVVDTKDVRPSTVVSAIAFLTTKGISPMFYTEFCESVEACARAKVSCRMPDDVFLKILHVYEEKIKKNK